MSYPPFFPNDDQQQYPYQRPQRPTPPLLLDSAQRSTWSPTDDSNQQDLAQYYALSSALYYSPKLDNNPQLYPNARYNNQPFLQQSFQDYNPPNDLILLPPSNTQPPPVKDEPSTPTSPQFIFEFPGGTPEQCPLDPPDPPDLPPLDPIDPPSDDEMKSMMSVFRVDPFASYDAHPRANHSHHRRRPRPSSYAARADPAAAAREPPLLLTFQLDVPLDEQDEFPPQSADHEALDFSNAYAPPDGGTPYPPDTASYAPSDGTPPFAPAYLLGPSSPGTSQSPTPPPTTRATTAKTHTCWICHKEFPRPSGLATHMHTHSGAKPYRCPVPTCAKPFAVRSNARRHLRTHSPHELASAIPPADPDPAPDTGFPTLIPEDDDLLLPRAGPTAHPDELLPAYPDDESPSPPAPGGGGFPLGPFPDDVKCEFSAFQFGGGGHGGVGVGGVGVGVGGMHPSGGVAAAVHGGVGMGMGMGMGVGVGVGGIGVGMGVGVGMAGMHPSSVGLHPGVTGVSVGVPGGTNPLITPVGAC